MTINDLNKLKPQLAYFVLSVPIHISHFFVQFFVEADDSAISADASTFSVCLGVIFAEFSDANAC